MTDPATALEPLVERLAETAPGLRVETGPGSTGLYAYDASNYRVPPRAVVFPRSADDVVAVLRACREDGVRVTAVGGGASTAGDRGRVRSWVAPGTGPDPGHRSRGAHGAGRGPCAAGCAAEHDGAARAGLPSGFAEAQPPHAGRHDR